MYFLFDENIPYKLVQGLALIEEANKKSPYQATITHPVIENNAGASDEGQIALAGKKNAIIVSFDKDFKHIKSYYPLYKKYKVGVVVFRLAKADSNYWGIVKLIINNWEKLKKELSDKERPFIYEVNKLGIKPLFF